MKSTPKGMRDILPEDAIVRREVFETIEKIYRKYGFIPMETPAMEYMETLRAKAGEEADKQIFVLKNEELGLRFDLTLPLARVVANNAFAKPFKRYYIAPSWRYEEPQRGRYREFWQADVDIIGSRSMRAEAELLTVAREALFALGFKNPKILINNRKILDALSIKLGIEKKKEIIFRLLDKIDKVGEDKVKKEMSDVIGSDKTKKLFELFDTTGDNKKKLEVARTISEEGAREIEEILQLCDPEEGSSKNFDIEISLSLVRGLGYYTGPVFEIKASDEIGSVAGGGRYDNLLGIYGQADYAVGISLGIDRIMALIKERKKETAKTYTTVFVACAKPEFFNNTLGIAAQLREKNIACEVDLNERNLRKQLEYVNAILIPYMIVVGERELKEEEFTLRDMKSGKEEKMNIQKLIEKLLSVKGI